jgi:hypothetical protein
MHGCFFESTLATLGLNHVLLPEGQCWFLLMFLTRSTMLSVAADSSVKL